jgi:hypothetical protein
MIIGNPGCSKSLSIRLLLENLRSHSNEKDSYISKYKAVRQYAIQGSEMSTSEDISKVFERAYSNLAESKNKLSKPIHS